MPELVHLFAAACRVQLPAVVYSLVTKAFVSVSVYMKFVGVMVGLNLAVGIAFLQLEIK